MWDEALCDDDISNFPDEAYSNPFDAKGPFDPSNTWLATASEEDQLVAMRAWFLSRYCDPANSTPYNGREGGYQFVHGGPYDPEEELCDRFGSIVDENRIRLVIDEMYEMVGEDWAPIQSDYREEEQEYLYELSLNTKDKPATNLVERLDQINLILTLQGDPQARKLVLNFALGAAIGALEAYLWEVAYYWVENDEEFYKNVIEGLPAFNEKTIKLGDIFKEHANLKNQVKAYMQNLVWHNWEKVARLFQTGFGFKPPGFKVFEDALMKRHDIVHRSGFDRDGNAVEVTIFEIENLRTAILSFSNELEMSLTRRSFEKVFGPVDV